jgi:DNA-binding beta-propeller fold protein YncE
MKMGKFILNSFACIGIAIVAGCNTPQKKVSAPIFYPPAPEPPRLQYLTSYSAPSQLTPLPSGFMTFILGKEPDSRAAIAKPYGMDVRNSKLYVCDTIPSFVHILDFAEQTWEYFQPRYQAALKKPINIAVDAQEMRYIVDPLRGDVAIYDSTGKLIDSIGREQGMKPVGVAVSEDRIHIADLNHKVYVFDKASRTLLLTIPRIPDNEQEQLYSPTNVAVDQQGNIYVSDTGGCRVQKYAPDGTYLQTIGSQGDAPGQFARNKGVAVDRNGILYVVDAATQTVQMFDAKGDLLLYFGAPGEGPSPLTLPADVVIDYGNVELFQSYADENFEVEYLVFISSQYGPRKISVYGFGQKKEP